MESDELFGLRKNELVTKVRVHKVALRVIKTHVCLEGDLPHEAGVIAHLHLSDVLSWLEVYLSALVAYGAYLGQLHRDLGVLFVHQVGSRLHAH